MKILTATFACLAILYLFSCRPNTDKISSEIPVPVILLSSAIKTTNYTGTEYPVCFEAAFSDSTFVKEVTSIDSTIYAFETKELGKIKIISGKLLACDPIVLNDAKPFSNNFPVGEFKVQLAIAKIPNNNRVAFSRIVFSQQAVKKWIFATRVGEKQIDINDSTAYCFGVDAGKAIYADSITNAVFSKKSQSEWSVVFANNKWYNTEYFGRMHAFENQNFAVFATGFGAGCYVSYIGLDSNNNICRLLTDFGFIRW